MKNVTAKQYVARRTNSYRARYRRMFVEPDADREERYTPPESRIPRADHAFQIGPFLVSRPYGMDGDAIRDLTELTAKHDLEFSIASPSSWTPATVLVQVYSLPWAEEFYEDAKAHGEEFHDTVRGLIYRALYASETRVYTSFRPREGGGAPTGVTILSTNDGERGVMRGGTPREIDHFVEAKAGYNLSQEG